MIFRYLSITPATALLLLGLVSPSAHAINNNQWGTISDVSDAAMIGTALIYPSTKKDWQGLRQASYGIVTSIGVTQLGKATIHEKRPNNRDNKSFPSGHAATAFASATTLHRRYGWEVGVPAYAVATFVAGARVAAREHYVHDVVAGAAVGIISGWFFTDPYDDSVQLNPWLDSDGGGVSVSWGW